MSANSKPMAALGTMTATEKWLLDSIMDHGIITKETWVTPPPRRKWTATEMSSAMWSLTRRKIVVARPLHHGKTYFALSASTVHKLGLPENKGKELAEFAKLRVYAQLLFFTAYDKTAKRLRRDELAVRIAEPTHGLPQGFYARARKKNFLGFTRVDTHLSTLPMRSAQTLRHDVFRFVSLPSVRERIKNKTFEFTWITATQDRADAVMQIFCGYDRIGKAPIRVIVMKELVPLVCSVQFADSLPFNPVET